MRTTVLLSMCMCAACPTVDNPSEDPELGLDAGDGQASEAGEPHAHGPDAGLDGMDAATACSPTDCESGYCFNATQCSAPTQETWWATSGDQQLRAWALDAAGNRYVAYLEPPPGLSAYPWVPKLTKFGPDRQPIWSRDLELGAQENVTAMLVDPDGHLMTLSTASGPVDGQTHVGGSDWVLSRWTPDGEREWTRQAGTADSDIPDHLTLAADGTFWITGSWGHDPMAPKGEGVAAQWSAAGDELRRFSYGSNGRTRLGRVALDAEGHIFLVGDTHEQWGPLEDPSVSDIFVMRLKADGSVEWTLQLASQWGDSADYAIADEQGGVWIGGSTSGDFETTKNVGLADVLTLHIDAEGKLDWVVPIASGHDEYISNLVRTPDGDLLVAGRAYQDLDPQSPQDMLTRLFWARVGPRGELRGVQRFGVGGDLYAADIAVDVKGHVHLVTSSPNGATGVDLVFVDVAP